MGGVFFIVFFKILKTTLCRSPMLDLFPSNLRELDLSFNSLEGISQNAFQPLTSLTHLILQVA